jgi:hypothetical protein
MAIKMTSNYCAISLLSTSYKILPNVLSLSLVVVVPPPQLLHKLCISQHFIKAEVQYLTFLKNFLAKSMGA